MTSSTLFVAAADGLTAQVEKVTQRSSFDSQGVMLIIASGVGVGLFLFVMVYLYYSRKRHRQESREMSRSVKPVSTSAPTDDDPDRRRRRKRRRRREHRPSNPPLSKTGGLPPPRPEGEIPKY